jgi:nitrite reductase (NADH) small subunit
MLNWIDVAGIDELIPDAGVCALIAQRQIAIFYLPKINAVFAIDNLDPVSGAAVLSRGMVGDLSGEPMVASPLYKQHYSLRTGVCLDDPALKVAVYPVQIKLGRVQLALN